MAEDRFEAFRLPAFRNLWISDALTLWGFEMEALILAWFVLQESNSALLVSIVAAMRFGGSLISPVMGVYVDRLSKRAVMIGIRVGFLAIAIAMTLAASFGRLEVWHALVAATVSGLLRPPEMVVRQALIADTVPGRILMSAMGFSRINLDWSKIVGALAGAGTMAALGIANAFLFIVVLYVLSLGFCLKIPPQLARAGDGARNALQELRDGITHIREVPALTQLMYLAFLANLVSYPVTYGLLPVVARDTFGLDELGLAEMLTIAAVGALIGSIVLGLAKGRRATQWMLLGLIGWQASLLLFAFAPSLLLANIALFVSGFASSLAMTSMSVVLMQFARPEFRGRVMGVRMLAVYGLPMGLLLGGLGFEQLGVDATLILIGAGGLALILWRVWRWRVIVSSVA